LIFFIKDKANFFWQKQIIGFVFYHASFIGINSPFSNPAFPTSGLANFPTFPLPALFKKFWALPAAEGRAGRAFRSKSSLYAAGFPLQSLTQATQPLHHFTLCHPDERGILFKAKDLYI